MRSIFSIAALISRRQPSTRMPHSGSASSAPGVSFPRGPRPLSAAPQSSCEAPGFVPSAVLNYTRHGRRLVMFVAARHGSTLNPPDPVLHENTGPRPGHLFWLARLNPSPTMGGFVVWTCSPAVEPGVSKPVHSSFCERLVGQPDGFCVKIQVSSRMELRHEDSDHIFLRIDNKAGIKESAPVVSTHGAQFG
jgi:hypothetical protein